MVKKYVCLGCKTALDDNSMAAMVFIYICVHTTSSYFQGAAVCSSCQVTKADIYQAEITCHAAFEREFCYLWTQCQRCQGSLHEDILCTRLA